MEYVEMFRGCERLLVVCGGIASIILGGLLLKWGIFVPGNLCLSGDAGERTGKFRITLQNATPGAVFALFGAIVLSTSLFSPATLSSTSGKTHSEWRYSDQTTLVDFLDKVSTLKDSDTNGLDGVRTEARTLKARFSKGQDK
jgi:hypothetical protein